MSSTAPPAQALLARFSGYIGPGGGWNKQQARFGAVVEGQGDGEVFRSDAGTGDIVFSRTAERVTFSIWWQGSTRYGQAFVWLFRNLSVDEGSEVSTNACCQPGCVHMTERSCERVGYWCSTEGFLEVTTSARVGDVFRVLTVPAHMARAPRRFELRITTRTYSQLEEQIRSQAILLKDLESAVEKQQAKVSILETELLRKELELLHSDGCLLQAEKKIIELEKVVKEAEEKVERREEEWGKKAREMRMEWEKEVEEREAKTASELARLEKEVEKKSFEEMLHQQREEFLEREIHTKDNLITMLQRMAACTPTPWQGPPL